MIAVFALTLFAAPVAVIQHSASAQDIQSSLCKGADLSFSGDDSCEEDGVAASDKVDSLIADVVDVISVIVGIVAVIMIIYGGFRYITSGGDSGNVSNAKNTILYAIIGLVIVALAQFIVKFVLNTSSGLSSDS